MRMRHHFQPMLESMPTRIAPSAVGGLIAPFSGGPRGRTLASDASGVRTARYEHARNRYPHAH